MQKKKKNIKNKLWANQNMVKSKNFGIKGYKKRREEKTERKKFKLNDGSDDEYENYGKYDFDSEIDYVDSNNDGNQNELKHFNRKNNKQKTPLPNKKIRRTMTEKSIEVYNYIKNN